MLAVRPTCFFVYGTTHRLDVGLRLSQLHAVSIALLRQSGESSSNLITFLIVRNKQLIIRSGGYNEHVTVEGKVFFIWQGVDVTTKPSTVLVHKYVCLTAPMRVGDVVFCRCNHPYTLVVA